MTGKKKKTGITEQAKKKIIAAISEEFQAAGLGRFDEAVQLMEEERELLMQGVKGGILTSALKMLRDAPEPSNEALEQTIANITGKLRYQLGPAIMETLQQCKKKFCPTSTWAEESKL